MGLRTWLGLKESRAARASTGNLDFNPSFEGYRLIEERLVRPAFPIDLVYTWVDSAEPDFAAVLSQYLPPGAAETRDIVAPSRFACHEELRYSLRSAEYFAPWIKHIYIVTNGQVPRWLAPHPKVSVVSHEDILESEYLPTFNSHVIESALHRIPNLSEHYLYFNDDVMLLRPLEAGDAFTGNGLSFGFAGDITIRDGPPIPDETATNWGAKNARDLALRQWGRAIDRRFAHSFHPQLKSVAEECERLFQAEYRAFRANRFRHPNDVLCCSYLHPVAAYLMQRGLFAYTTLWYVKVRDLAAPHLYGKILAERGSEQARLAVCLNDVIPRKNALEHYTDHLRAFLEAYYPMPSPFEQTSIERDVVTSPG